jgi:hypothetical protein
VRLELMTTEKSNDVIGNGIRDLPACSIVPQSTTLPCVLRLPRRFNVPGPTDNTILALMYKIFFAVNENIAKYFICCSYISLNHLY